MKGQEVLLKSSCDSWATPQYLFDYLDYEFKFQLDPCATKKNTKCISYFHKRDNGLKQEWKVKSVFVNPPYSDIKQWVKKCYEESKKGSTVVMLIPARVDTTYWHDIIFPYAKEIRFIRGRLKFNNHPNPATFPSAVIVFKKSIMGQKVTTITKEELNMFKP